MDQEEWIKSNGSRGMYQEARIKKNSSRIGTDVEAGKKLQIAQSHSFTGDGRSMTSFYYGSVNHQSGLQSNTF